MALDPERLKTLLEWPFLNTLATLRRAIGKTNNNRLSDLRLNKTKVIQTRTGNTSES